METRFFDLSQLDTARIARFMTEVAPNADGYLGGSLSKSNETGRYKMIFGQRNPVPEFENLTGTGFVEFLCDAVLPHEISFNHAGDPMYHGALSLELALKVATHFVMHGYAGTVWMHLQGRGSHPKTTDLRFRLNDLPVDGFDHDHHPWRLRIDTGGYAIESIMGACQRFELHEYFPDTVPA